MIGALHQGHHSSKGHLQKLFALGSLLLLFLRIMARAGINIQVFGAHSTRAAATSHAKQCGVSFRQIAKAADWASAKTFASYYDKPIEMTLSEAFHDC